MATNHTEHYQLSQWTAEDSFLREEFNEDFRKIDGAIAGKCEVAVGSYTGDGTSERVISLGFRPLAVLLERETGKRDVNSIYGGLLTGDLLRDDGFLASTTGGMYMNTSGRVYTYLAFYVKRA